MQGAINGGLAQPGGWTQAAPQPCAVQQGSGAPRPDRLQAAGPAQPFVPQLASAPQPGPPAVPSARPSAGRSALPTWQQLPDPDVPTERARAAAPPAVAAATTAEARPLAAVPTQPQQPPPRAPVTTGADRQPFSPTVTPGLRQLIVALLHALRLIAFELGDMLAMPLCGRSPLAARDSLHRTSDTSSLCGSLALCTQQQAPALHALDHLAVRTVSSAYMQGRRPRRTRSPPCRAPRQ